MARRASRVAVTAVVVALVVACGDDDTKAEALDAAAGEEAGAADFGNPEPPEARDASASDRDPLDGGTFAGGGCGRRCFVNASGAGTDRPFDLENNPSDGVGLDEEGGLVLVRQNAASAELIWIANTGDHRPRRDIYGTVSKVDTNSYQELGRYAVPGIDTAFGDENGPSRTSVDSDGNVYAGARLGTSITKISSAGEDCPDTNGDGIVTTSAGVDDVLSLGADDCVVWSTDIGGDARGVAVQETATRFELVDALDGESPFREIAGARYVWVGGREDDSIRLHKLDAETGELLFTIVPPTRVYGLALDGRGNLWTASQREAEFGRVDTTRCVDDSCAMEPVCVTQCSESSCPDTCDGAVLERIRVVDDEDEEAHHSGYGITVDCKQRIWIGGAHGGDGVKRYDPFAEPDERLHIIRDIAGDGVDGIHGIAADASGWVWGGARDLGVWRIDGDTLEYEQVAGTGGQRGNAKGIAIDRRGRVWAVPFRLDYAMVITPGPTLGEATVEWPVDGFVAPYTYSDMTGEQRRLAANEPGTYRHMVSGCAGRDKPTTWREFDFDVEAPDGTFVVFRARTAERLQDLEDAVWFTLAAAPRAEGPVDISHAIELAQQQAGRYLEVEVRLFAAELAPRSESCETPALTPRVKALRVSFECPPELE